LKASGHIDQSLYSILYTCWIYSCMGHLRTPRCCWPSLWNSSWNILCRDRNFVRLQRSDSCAICRICLALVNWYRSRIFGQASTYWRWIAPRNYRHGIITGLIVGAALWAVLFVPVTTFGIQPRLDSFSNSAPNQYVYDISSHFQSLYPVIVGGSLVFHLIYGSLLGFIAGRMKELGTFLKKDIHRATFHLTMSTD